MFAPDLNTKLGIYYFIYELASTRYFVKEKSTLKQLIRSNRSCQAFLVLKIHNLFSLTELWSQQMKVIKVSAP